MGEASITDEQWATDGIYMASIHPSLQGLKIDNSDI